MEPIYSERTAVTSRELLTLASSDKIHTSQLQGWRGVGSDEWLSHVSVQGRVVGTTSQGQVVSVCSPGR